ncbi:MAG: flagellar type III secretion system protein FlhB [Hydrogenophilaceae bacterium]|nr:flagellar type III secretion system protein FlhB [Hydrogenophilaceae bacterium]
MAEESDLEKTESPSPRKLEKAREEGQVPQSRELSAFMVLMASGGAIWMLGDGFAVTLTEMLRAGLRFDHRLATDPGVLMNKTMHQLGDTIFGLAPLLLVIVAAALAGPLVLHGWIFNTKALTPQFSRINPLSGLKRMVSVDSLSELVKSLAKVSLLGLIAGWVMWKALDALFALGLHSVEDGAREMAHLLVKAFLVISAGMLFVVLLDVPYQLWRYYTKLKMTREEIRQEVKESEGDPHVKARIRSMQREVARRRMMSEIPTADVVVTNPTHYAVALKYSEGTMRAPRVVAKGADLLAARIREEAGKHHVPILEAPPLARALYRHTELEQEIPVALYTAVAEVLAYVYQLKRYQSSGGERPQAPADLPVPPELDPVTA